MSEDATTADAVATESVSIDQMIDGFFSLLPRRFRKLSSGVFISVLVKRMI